MPLSPMMQQYFKVKEETPDCILLYRLGDFYEMFFEDAKIASKVLDIVLTSRDCGDGAKAPMCGIPYHAADSYMHRLIKAGYRVAVAEQMEDPKKTKGIVDRQVMRIISAGTVTDGDYLENDRNNYFACVYKAPEGIGVCFCDVSTGDVRACQFAGRDSEQHLYSESEAYSPAEAIVFGCEDVEKTFAKRFGTRISQLDTGYDFFDRDNVSRQLASVSDKMEGEETPLARVATGALLAHLQRVQKMSLDFIKDIKFYNPKIYMQLDGISRRNLELTESASKGEKKGSLLWVLDKTKTSMGARALRRRIETPLMEPKKINERLDVVEEFVKNRSLREEIQKDLSEVSDLERLCARIASGSANPRDLLSLSNSLACLSMTYLTLQGHKNREIARLNEELGDHIFLAAEIGRTIMPDPPVSYKEGGVFKERVSREIDELRAIISDSKSWIAEMEKSEKEKTGIKTLKIGYNRVFGYYIEVSSREADLVPEAYIRRQTLADKERFVTGELKEMEDKVINARGRLYELEAQMFIDFVARINKSIKALRKTAEAAAEIDVYLSLAQAADENNYVRPTVDLADKITIKAGRHPVVEKLCGDSFFVPNDVKIDTDDNRIHLITGPNMAGKSTYMRQVAITMIMAQMGSFVPADSAHIGVTDRIFTRVGASDDLSGGSSTFMMEMKEVAHILKNAKLKSLIIYDEIGRGTATYDGMSIAKAVVEYTSTQLKSRTLFATHYHELTEMEGKCDGVINYNISAKKRGDDIIFLRRIVRGPASESYGIEVASLAGVPDKVVKRAKEILKETVEKAPSLQQNTSQLAEAEDDEITIFDLAWENMKDKLRKTDINTITPIEAMSMLYEIKKLTE